MTSSCASCGSDKTLQSHHITYYPERRVGLCDACHRKAHENKSHPYSPKQKARDLFDNPEGVDDVADNATVTIKQINKNAYFYWQWRDGDSIKSKFICAVSEAENHKLFAQTEVVR